MKAFLKIELSPEDTHPVISETTTPGECMQTLVKNLKAMRKKGVDLELVRAQIILEDEKRTVMGEFVRGLYYARGSKQGLKLLVERAA
ncbi:hypothetical protein [Pseudoalteromonas sp.]|uniref:hypothetical protein n=1 Tax=Pseudoalteromonas sp. TaxID=53249 RepID=UPI00272DA272|nr:hypothetical protein [Pseudoalteromonas sp.]